MAFIFLEETTSTNDVARRTEYRHGDLIAAEYQTAGRGQRGNRWSSSAGKNLMFSVVLEPTFLPAARQFLLSEAVALALADTLAQYGIDARIKWTNDIYVGDKKITGILIEHELHGANLARTVVGIGLNINQTEFDPSLPNPTSMQIVAGREFDRREVLERLYANLMRRYDVLGTGCAEQLQSDYHRLLYRLDEPHTFSTPDGKPFTGIIRGVEPDGGLIVESSDGKRRSYLFKQIEFVI